ncbi:MAG TPA: ThuA domain-containing protein [Bacteroidia bacterium]|nr:ThuA domain-containing protein [Bacteroidia bacterium]
MAGLVGPCHGADPVEPRPIRILLVSGGCSHDYATRQGILKKGISARLVKRTEWRTVLQGAGESDARIPLFGTADWAKDCDVVIHDHCFPRVADAAYVDRVLAPHREGVPAVLLHGSMMSFRTGDDRWFEFCGVSAQEHEKARNVEVKALLAGHPVLGEAASWTSSGEELYWVERTWPGVEAFAEAKALDGTLHPVVWAHLYGPSRARVFATSLGNDTVEVADGRYLDMVARGVLWALDSLDGDSFQTVELVEQVESKKPKPLLRPGPNLAATGTASGFFWGVPDSSAAGLACDGDPSTVWRTEKLTPGSWEIRWAEPQRVGAVLVQWQGPIPPEARIDGTTDGETWTELVEIAPALSTADSSVVVLPPGEFAGLRLSVVRPDPVHGFGIREIAAYPSLEAVPSAFVAAMPEEAFGTGAMPAAKIEAPPGLSVRAGWRIVRQSPLVGKGRVVQVVPTASGSVFVVRFPEDPSAAGWVERLDPTEGADYRSMRFLEGIPPGTCVAWDGEWLHTLSGPALNPVRKALGSGPADERGRTTQFYSSDGKNEPSGLVFNRLRLGEDGWLYAKVSCESVGTVEASDGRQVAIPRCGVVRFRRDGTGLSVCVRSSREFHDYGFDSNGIPRKAKEGDALREVVVRSGLSLGERDGDRAVLVEERDGALWLVGFAAGDSDAVPDWNLVPANALRPHLVSQRPSVRCEAALEMLRRKRDSLPGILAAIREGKAMSDGERRSILTVVVGRDPTGARKRLEALLAEGSPEWRPSVLLALADLPVSRDHPVFAKIDEGEVPGILAARLEAVRRCDPASVALGEIAWRLADHRDSRVAEIACEILLDRAPDEREMARLERAHAKEDKLSVLEELPDDPDLGTVEWLAAEWQATLAPAYRREVLAKLCDFHHAGTGPLWEGDGKVKQLLDKALADRRVDRVALLEERERRGIPSPDAELLVRLAKDDGVLEKMAIEEIRDWKVAPSPESLAWLESVADDEDRDGEQRLGAVAAMVREDSGVGYRESFAKVASSASLDGSAAAKRRVNGRWFGRGDHRANGAWLLGQAASSVPERRFLAMLTLLATGDEAKEVALFDLSALAGSLAGRIADLPEAVVGKLARWLADDRMVAETLRLPAAAAEREPTAGDWRRDLDGLLGPPDGDEATALAGKLVFQGQACGSCHNIHGEGPVSAPRRSVSFPGRSWSRLWSSPESE